MVVVLDQELEDARVVADGEEALAAEVADGVYPPADGDVLTDIRFAEGAGEDGAEGPGRGGGGGGPIVARSISSSMTGEDMRWAMETFRVRLGSRKNMKRRTAV